jgi:hypothetical protein
MTWGTTVLIFMTWGSTVLIFMTWGTTVLSLYLYFPHQSLWHGVQRFYHCSCIFHINRCISIWVWVSVSVMVFNGTFNNISVKSWRSVLLVEETGVPRENHWPVASHFKQTSHNVVSSTPCHERGSNSHWLIYKIRWPSTIHSLVIHYNSWHLEMNFVPRYTKKTTK